MSFKIISVFISELDRTNSVFHMIKVPLFALLTKFKKADLATDKMQSFQLRSRVKNTSKMFIVHKKDKNKGQTSVMVVK